MIGEPKGFLLGGEPKNNSVSGGIWTFFLTSETYSIIQTIYDMGIPTGIKNNKNINYDENTNNPK